MKVVSRKPLIFVILGALIWIVCALLATLYYFNKIADHDNFYADPSPAPLFILTFFSGVGLLITIASAIVLITQYTSKK